jgi:hypothetical protein
MLKSARPNAGQIAAVRQIKNWTRERFTLTGDMVVVVSELECGAPGCPPLETVVTFWTDENHRHAFKVFKPITKVQLEDFPPYWMKRAIISTSDDLSCC